MILMDQLLVYAGLLTLIVMAPFIGNMIGPLFSNIGYGTLEDTFASLIGILILSLGMIVSGILFKMRSGKNLLSEQTKIRELSVRKMILLELICIGCIVLVSGQIEFSVKIFYDFGRDTTGYAFMGYFSGVLYQVIRLRICAVLIRLGQEIVETATHKQNSRIPFGGILLMSTVGVYDLIMGNYTLPIIYMGLNVVFGLIYIISERSIRKTYLMSVLIFLL